MYVYKYVLLREIKIISERGITVFDTSRSQSRLPVADLASFPTRSQEKKLSLVEDPYQNFH